MKLEITKGVEANVPQRDVIEAYKTFVRQHDVRFIRDAPKGTTIKAGLTDRSARRYVEKLFDRACVDFKMKFNARKREITWTKI